MKSTIKGIWSEGVVALGQGLDVEWSEFNVGRVRRRYKCNLLSKILALIKLLRLWIVELNSRVFLPNFI